MSQANSTEITVGDHVYYCFKLSPWTMNEITHLILNTLGSTAGEFVLAFLAGHADGDADEIQKEAAGLLGEGGKVDKEKLGAFLEKNVNPKHLASGLREILQKINARDTRWLMERLAEKTTIKGGGKLLSEWEVHWLGRPMDMYKWAFGALRSQYGFLG